MGVEAAERNPDPNEQYCRSCGEIILQQAEICPECGVRNRAAPTAESESVASPESEKMSTVGVAGATVISLFSATIAFLFLPPVFGGVAIFCGYLVYSRYHELLGIGLMLYSGFAMVIGMLIGMLLWV